MTNSWQTTIQQQHTLSNAQTINTESTFTPLPQLGLLKVTGDDSQSFLQSLLTNDVAELAVNQSQLTGFCNAKGRLFALFLLIRRQDAYQLVLPSSMCQLLLQRLSMYVLRAKVTITNETNNVALLSINNNDISHASTLGLNEDCYQSLAHNQCLCIIPKDKIEAVLSQFKELNWSLNSEKTWNIGTIDTGLPMIFPETKEKFTPQQVNLDLVNGVSFKKGCYPGQEVVARLHYLGSPSRRMFKAEIASTQCPTVGDEIVNEAGNTAGHIVCSEMASDSLVKVLVSLKLSERDAVLSTTDAVAVRLTDTNTPQE